MRKKLTLSFLSILGAALLAGCGTATGTLRAAGADFSGPAATTAGTAGSGPTASGGGTASASTVGQASQTPQQQAAAQAKAILGAFVPPPGAVRLAGRPKLPGGSPSMGLTAATQRDVVEYWRAPGTATSLQAWEKAHLPRRFSRQDVIVGPPSWSTLYTLPAVAGVLPAREMNVQFYDTGGSTVIMADAMVSWQPPRSASEVVPADVTVVTIAPDWSGTGAPKAVTSTSPRVVQQLRALVNGLPLSTTGQRGPCPEGPGFTFTFRASRDAVPAAVVSGPGACGVVSLTIGGKDQPRLQAANPGAYTATVLKIAGLHWKLD